MVVFNRLIIYCLFASPLMRFTSRNCDLVASSFEYFFDFPFHMTNIESYINFSYHNNTLTRLDFTHLTHFVATRQYDPIIKSDMFFYHWTSVAYWKCCVSALRIQTNSLYIKYSHTNIFYFLLIILLMDLSYYRHRT